MSRKLLDKIRQRLKAETGTMAHSWSDGRYRVALVYPNSYHHGMSNLGLLTVYHLLNSRDDCLCERFFLPDPEELQEHETSGFPLISQESQRPLMDFDLIAFSVSFENDYLHLPTIFRLARIPLFSAERDTKYPPVLLGGVCAFLNPEPLAEIVDLVAVGEAEPILPALVDALQSGGENREELLIRLAQLPGIYVPSLYRVEYHDDGSCAAMTPHSEVPGKVARQYLKDLDSSPSRSFIQTPGTEFGDMALTEVSRGCSRGCRFCAAGYVYLPPRDRSLGNLLEQVDSGLCQRDKIGLVGAAVADYPQIELLQQGILQRGGKVSVSSLRLDALTEAEVDGLRASGHRTVSIAPEAGSQRLRDLINKGLDEEQILASVRLLADGDILHLKLYFLIGLPTETEEDLDALLQLTEQIRLLWREAGRRRGSLGTVTLSVNPFIPKPFTPLQWAAMDGEKVLKKKIRFLRSAVSRMPNTELHCESIRSARLQALLARGDRRTARLLPLLEGGDNLRQACRTAGLDADFYVGRERNRDELFPWEIIDQGVRRDYLWAEYERGLTGGATSRCLPGCRRCGICH